MQKIWLAFEDEGYDGSTFLRAFDHDPSNDELSQLEDSFGFKPNFIDIVVNQVDLFPEIS
jgi:hypothetical protein